MRTSGAPPFGISALGLTFFGDNVKLQLQFGQFTQSQWETFMSEEMRYGVT
jgi:hypothetical protein